MDSKILLKNLFQAYYDARKNKRGTMNALKFEMEFEKNLFELRDELLERQYTIKPSICFVTMKPVQREIFASDFRARVVHHLIFNYISPIFEKIFIHDSYSCRVGKGTSLGVKRLNYFIRSCSQNYQKDCWILKLDIKGYFMAMDRKILYEKIKAVLEKRKEKLDADLDFALYLLEKIIFNDPTKNCHVKGTRGDWIGLPKSKSLFFAKNGKGFPIVNLTSQLFGNIYLDEFDHFVREKIGLKHYGRYVDDILIIHKDKKYLKSIIPALKKYLRANLLLELHPKKIYLQHFRKGVSFLGVYIKPYRVYAGRRIKGNFCFKINQINDIIKKKIVARKEAKNFLPSINSYLGIMKHYQTYRLRKRILKKLDSRFWQYFSLAPDLSKISVRCMKNP